MTYLSLDPSSKVCGYCVFADPWRVIEAGLFKPSPMSAPAQLRALDIASQVIQSTRESKPARVIIETPGKRPPRAMRGMATVGQANYGYAVGVLVARLMSEGLAVVRAPADEWTRTSKQRRAASLVRLCPSYDASKDKGGDMADAIELGHWWVSEQKRKSA